MWRAGPSCRHGTPISVWRQKTLSQGETVRFLVSAGPYHDCLMMDAANCRNQFPGHSHEAQDGQEAQSQAQHEERQDVPVDLLLAHLHDAVGAGTVHRGLEHACQAIRQLHAATRRQRIPGIISYYIILSEKILGIKLGAASVQATFGFLERTRPAIRRLCAPMDSA